MEHFKVETVIGSKPFTSKMGPLVDWTIKVSGETGEQVISINTKPENTIKTGDDFWAEYKGKEFNGIKQYKKVKAPDGVSHGETGHAAYGGSSRMDFDRACQIYKECFKRFPTEEGFPHEFSTSMFIAIMRGQIGEPPAF